MFNNTQTNEKGAGLLVALHLIHKALLHAAPGLDPLHASLVLRASCTQTTVRKGDMGISLSEATETPSHV